eukprot:gene17005-20238_t
MDLSKLADYSDVTNSHLVSTLPTAFNFNRLSTLILNTNPEVKSDNIPQSFCQINQLSFIDTNIGVVAGTPVGYSCTPTVNNPDSIKVKPGESWITITGSNLGWATPGDADPNLSVITANTMLKYIIQNPTDSKTGIKLSTNVILPKISWSDVDIMLDIISPSAYQRFTMDSGGKYRVEVKFNFTGTLGMPLDQSVTVNGNYCDRTILDGSQIICKITQPLEDGPILLKLSNNANYASTTINFIRSYPIVTSISKITTAGGEITIDGQFGNDGFDDSQLFISINNVNCTGRAFLGLSLTCIMPPTDAGVVPVDLGFNGFVTQTTMLVCGNITANVTAPVASFEVSGYTFKFKMESIQELSANGSIVNELLTRSWHYNQSVLGEVTTLSYNLNVTTPDDEDNGTLPTLQVSSMIEYSSLARQVTFAGITSNLSPNAIKISVNITGWQYSSSLNTLRVVFSAPIDQQETDCNGDDIPLATNSQLDDSLQYLSIVKDGVVFYGRFLSHALSNGRPTYSRNELINSTHGGGDAYIGIHLPQCSTCQIDPDFGLLVSPRSSDLCDDDNTRSWFLPVVIAVPLVVVLMVSIVLIKVIRQRYYFKGIIPMSRLG